MRFNPSNCKVVSINSKSSHCNLEHLSLLPLSRFNYNLGDNILDYEANERDLSVIINYSFTWDEHHNKVINKAS